jgi:asparagine synthase (glutamine-hydrolysing)
MCGICGILHAPSSQLSARGRTAIDLMTAAMQHRGPDEHGTFTTPAVSLGMTRLAVLDLSPTGRQPMHTPDGQITIVYNGEVYNFAEQKRQLEAAGVVFAGTSDTEVILRLYERFGDDFTTRLNGMFAVAIHDRRGAREGEPGRVVIARDHLGIKPLYYTEHNGTFIFASELKALVASGCFEARLNPRGLRHLLVYGCVLQPETLLAGVFMLPPAHRLIWEGGRTRTEAYWQLAAGRVSMPAHHAGQVEMVRAALEAATRAQMVSDVPLGAFLSGGLDSSLLVALMSRITGRPMKTFSVGFTDAGAPDETDDAEQTARSVGAEHTRVLVSGSDLADGFAHFIAGMDQPSVDGVNTYLVSRAARMGVTVALSGLGGDELFGGYTSWFAAAVRAENRPAWLRAALEGAGGVLGSPAFDAAAAHPLSARLVNGARTRSTWREAYGMIVRPFDVGEAARLIAPALRTAAGAGAAAAPDLCAYDVLAGADPLTRVGALAVRGYMTQQLLRDADAFSMIHSLEVRVPFLDRPLVDLAFSLPPEAKLDLAAARRGDSAKTYRASGAKRILLDAAVGLLPADFDLRPKRGFGLPMAAWLRGPLRGRVAHATDAATVRARGLLEPAAVSAVRERFLTGTGHAWNAIWALTVLEYWAEHFGIRGA